MHLINCVALNNSNTQVASLDEQCTWVTRSGREYSVQSDVFVWQTSAILSPGG